MAVDNAAMMASLSEAGLVDGSGNFTSAPNFGGPAESGVRNDSVPNDDDVTEEKSQEQPNQEPASQPQVLPTQESPASGPPPSGTDVGVQDPARLGQEHDPIRTEYETTVSQMRQQAEMAFHYGRTLTNEQGERVYPDEVLAQNITRELQYAEQQAFLAGVMKRMQPVAQRAAAEKIAKEHGVDVSEIANESSPIVMETKAKTIAQLKRDGRFQDRKEAGTDTAEGSRGFSSAIPEAIDKLSPQQKMYVGFARGDY